MIVAVSGIDRVICVDGDAVNDVELVRTGAPGANPFQPMAARSDLDQARIAVAVGDEYVVVGIPGDIGGTIEGAYSPSFFSIFSR